MNNKELTADQDLSDIYQRSERDSSPVTLDQRVLAMAEARAPRSTAAMPRWLTAASAMAVAGLAIVLVNYYPATERQTPILESPPAKSAPALLQESAPATAAKSRMMAKKSEATEDSQLAAELIVSDTMPALEESDRADETDEEVPAEPSQLLVLLEEALQEGKGEKIRALFEQLKREYPQYEPPKDLAEKLQPWLTDQQGPLQSRQ